MFYCPWLKCSCFLLCIFIKKPFHLKNTSAGWVRSMTRDSRLLHRVWLKPQSIWSGCKSQQYRLYTLSTRSVRVWDQHSQAAQDPVRQGLYITPTEMVWMDKLRSISKLSSLWFLGETFFSLRYQSPSSNKTFFLCGSTNLKFESFLRRVLVPCKMLWTSCNIDAITPRSKADAVPNLPFAKIL